MRLLVIGGAGRVAQLVLPALMERHEIRIFDLVTPEDTRLAALPVTLGDASDGELLQAACQGVDALIYMAMGSPDWRSPGAISSAFDSNVRAVYISLEAAHAAGVSHAVYASSMSVYEGDLYTRYFPDEEIQPDSTHWYGLTKRLGEEVCRTEVRHRGITVNALRLCHPRPDETWMQRARLGTPTIDTAASDVANAFLAAVEYRGAGFEAFMISGDYEEKLMCMKKARRVLNWAPAARPAE